MNTSTDTSLLEYSLKEMKDIRKKNAKKSFEGIYDVRLLVSYSLNDSPFMKWQKYKTNFTIIYSLLSPAFSKKSGAR